MTEKNRDELRSDEIAETPAAVEAVGGDRQDDQSKDEEIVRLRRRVIELEEREERSAKMRSAAGGFLGRLVVGRSLEHAAEDWLNKARSGDLVSPRETSVLFAAILRRFVRVGVVGLLVAGLPTVVLIWQSFLIKDQNQFFREQNQSIREQSDTVLKQIDQQAEENRRNAEDTRIVRRAQLLGTIYDCIEDENPGERVTRYQEKEMCIPRATKRAQTEALLAFVEIERSSPTKGRGRVDLSSANFDGLDLATVDLRGAYLVNSSFFGAVLHGADLRGANLTNANLRGASFALGADLRGANLMLADLRGANLEGADLRRAKLHSADLSYGNITNAQLLVACGNELTRLADYLELPAHWAMPAPRPRFWDGCPPDDQD